MNRRTQFKNWLANDEGLSPVTVNLYMKSIEDCDKYVKRLGILESDYYLISDYRIVRSSVKSLLKNKEFCKHEKAQCSPRQIALYKYCKFLELQENSFL